MPQGPWILGISIDKDSSIRRFVSHWDPNCLLANGPSAPLDWKRIILDGLCFFEFNVLLVRGTWICLHLQHNTANGQHI